MKKPFNRILFGQFLALFTMCFIAALCDVLGIGTGSRLPHYDADAFIVSLASITLLAQAFADAGRPISV